MGWLIIHWFFILFLAQWFFSARHIYYTERFFFPNNRPITLFSLFLSISMANSFATPEPLTNINLDQDLLLGDVDSLLSTVAYTSIYRNITQQPEFPMRKNFIHR